jgi:hypothetical protein
VHDGIDTVCAQDIEYLLPVADRADNEWRVEYGLAKTSGQVVEDHDPLASGTELEDGMAADVAGASGD